MASGPYRLRLHPTTRRGATGRVMPRRAARADHVADPQTFLTDCASLVKPGGMMIVGTINRTSRAFVTAIFGAEYVMGWLPRGTHRFGKLVKPEEVEGALKAAGLTPETPVGVSYNPLKDSFFISSDSGVNYLMAAVKPA